jgi:uncharacterized membrane protein
MSTDVAMTLGRAVLGVVFIGAGVMHFVATAAYMKIVPPMLPDPRLLVQVSGVFEVLGGVGLLMPMTKWFAAWGLVALLVAIVPANVYMAMDHAAWPGIPVWALWARVPLQVPLIWWVWVYARAG